MRWVGVIFSLILVTGVIAVVAYIQSKRPLHRGDDFQAIRQKAVQSR
jgi:hypothetical protein